MVGAIAVTLFFGPASVPLYLAFMIVSKWNSNNAGLFETYTNDTKGTILFEMLFEIIGGPFFPIYEMYKKGNERNPLLFAQEHEKLKQEREKIANFFHEQGEEIANKLQNELNNLNRIRAMQTRCCNLAIDINYRETQLNSAIIELNNCREYYSSHYSKKD